MGSAAARVGAPGRRPAPPPSSRIAARAHALALVATGAVGAAAGRGRGGRAAARPAEVPYSSFSSLARDGAVVAAAVSPDRVTFDVDVKAAEASARKRVKRVTGGRGVLAAAEAAAAPGAPPAPSPPTTLTLTTRRIPGDAGVVALLDAAGVPFGAAAADAPHPAARVAAQCLALWLPLLPLFYLMSRAVNGRAGGAAKARRASNGRPAAPRTTFADVAGADGAKAELGEAVAVLKDPAAFAAIGARPPSGVLLYGPPGTGKTLLARAVAGEARVPFFAIAASEFVELYVGRGAARVRALFADARRAAPCVIFIDELDAVGGRRGGGSNDERDQTLNQLLTEMDGFDGAQGVLLLAATNRPDVLDPALVRPGRLSRRVAVPLPDAQGRAAILGVHLRRVRLALSADGGLSSSDAVALVAARLAVLTAGMSGAQLADVANDAALLALRRGAASVADADLDAALERVRFGVDGRSGAAATPGAGLARAARAALGLGGGGGGPRGPAPPPAPA